jgi:hypothetical protein
VTSEPASDSRDFVHRVETVLLERLDRLERENRRLRRFGNMTLVGIAIVVGVTVAMFWYSGRFGFAGGVPESVAARQFTLRDADGSTRGVWGVGEDGTVRLQLSDARGRPRVRVSLLADGSSGLSFADSTDHKVVVLGAFPDQSTSFVMSDRAGVARAVLGISSAGASNLVFADRDGSTKAGLGVDSRGQSSFTLTDRGARQAEEAPPEADTTDEAADSQPPVAPSRPAPRKK